jgi:hypothetical protein
MRLIPIRFYQVANASIHSRYCPVPGITLACFWHTSLSLISVEFSSTSLVRSHDGYCLLSANRIVWGCGRWTSRAGSSSSQRTVIICSLEKIGLFGTSPNLSSCLEGWTDSPPHDECQGITQNAKLFSDWSVMSCDLSILQELLLALSPSSP